MNDYSTWSKPHPFESMEQAYQREILEDWETENANPYPIYMRDQSNDLVCVDGGHPERDLWDIDGDGVIKCFWCGCQELITVKEYLEREKEVSAEEFFNE